MSIVLLVLQFVILLPPTRMLKSFTSVNTANTAAMAERTVRKVWEKCVKAEEANRMLKRLVREGVWTNGVEAFSHTKAGKEKWTNRGGQGGEKFVWKKYQAGLPIVTLKSEV